MSTFPEAIGYMTNCVHPIIVHETLSHPFNRTDTVRSRFIGIQANTSSLSYSELDGVHDLKESSLFDFTDETIKLLTEYHLKIVGDCCGTDNRHMEEIAKRLGFVKISILKIMPILVANLTLYL